MDFVNKAFTQVADVFRSMTPGARFTSALLLIAIVTSIGYLFRHQTNGAEVFLFSGEQFSQRELGAMSAAFSKAGLNQWVEIGDTIKVPRSQRHLYIQALSENGALPDHSSKKMDDNLSRSSPWESKTMQDRKFLFSREQDLSFLVENIQGIDQATVQLQEVEKGGFRSAKERRALVAVRCDGNKTLTEDQVRSIRLMVSQGGGAEPEHVTVTDMNANKTYQGRKENDLANPDDNMYAQTKRMFEQAWESNILKQLSMIPGVIVGVNVELDPDINNQINTLKFDEKPSAVEIKTFSKESTGAGGETGGRAGAVSNGVVGNTGRAVTADSKTASTNTETREDQKYMPGRTQTAIQKAPLTPKSVSVSISIPKSYYEKIWRQLNPTQPGQDPKNPEAVDLKNLEDMENKRYQAIVNNLLPAGSPGVDSKLRVVVSAHADIPLPPPEVPALTDHAVGWLSANWPTLAMIGVGMISLLVLRSMVRAGPSSTDQSSSALPLVSQPRTHDDDDDEEQDDLPGHRLRFQSSGRSLREELVELIREDPDSAANVLRNWIGEAA